MPRREWLKNYFHAMQRRKNWEGLDRAVVLKAIYAALAHEVDQRDD